MLYTQWKFLKVKIFCSTRQTKDLDVAGTFLLLSNNNMHNFCWKLEKYYVGLICWFWQGKCESIQANSKYYFYVYIENRMKTVTKKTLKLVKENLLSVICMLTLFVKI